MNNNLALFKRAILVDNRLLANYLSWLASGILLFFFLITLSSFDTSGLGIKLLGMVAGVNLATIVLSGIIGFSSTITEEKEESTIGLLLMSGISPTALIFSKSMARVTRGLFLILSQLPFVFLAVTLGGVSLNQVIALYLTLISFTIFLAFYCTFFSVICRTTTRAAIFSGVFCYIITVFTSNISFLEAIHPIHAYTAILNTGYSDYIFMGQVISNLVVAVVFFCLSVYLFPKFALKEDGTSKAKKSNKAITTRKRSWSAAIVWKDFKFYYGGYKMWTITLLIIIGFVAFTFIDNSRMDLDDFRGILAGTAATAVGIQLTFFAQTFISKEFRDLTHSGIFITPKTLSEIFKEKIYAGLLMCLPGILIFTVCVLPEIDLSEESFFVIPMVISYLALFLGLTFFFSLKVKLVGFILAGFCTMIINMVWAFIMFSGINSSFAGTALLLSFLNSVVAFTFINAGLNTVRSKLEA
ncbi:MAG: ABC transporter permease [Lentisphaeraceae bacterium]|nr:ABC transporter permease [Lentisphaeraceae bacterium]